LVAVGPGRPPSWGAIFPMIIHAWIPPDEKAARHVSWITCSKHPRASSCGRPPHRVFLLLETASASRATHRLLFFLALGQAPLSQVLRRGSGELRLAAAILIPRSLKTGGRTPQALVELYGKLQKSWAL